MSRILTLFFTRNLQTFNMQNYCSVLAQDVEQRIIIVSASPIPLRENITVSLSEKLPLPIRIGISFNRALKTLREKEGGLNYDYIFKVDGDVRLPKDYLRNLLSKKMPLAGIGYAFLIKKNFLTGF